MELAAAGASAVIVPGLITPLVGKLPGGQFAPILAGAVLLYGSMHVSGLAKAVAAGAGAGLIAASVVPMIIPSVAR